MIRRGNLAVSVTGSRDCRFGPSASTYALSRRTKARELQIDHLWRRSRAFRRMGKTLLNTFSVCNGSNDGVHDQWASSVKRLPVTGWKPFSHAGSTPAASTLPTILLPLVPAKSPHTRSASPALEVLRVFRVPLPFVLRVPRIGAQRPAASRKRLAGRNHRGRRGTLLHPIDHCAQ